MSLLVSEIPAPILRTRLYEALEVYVSAMHYPRGVEHSRAPMWAEHMLRDGWRAVAAFQIPDTGPGAAVATDDAATAMDDATAAMDDATAIPEAARLVGIAYGYHGAPAYWWDRQVRSAVRDTAGPEGTRLMSDYFELTEIHVAPSAQGKGIGAALLTRLLSGLAESRVLLSTPEVPEEQNRAWQLYRRMGFEDVLRHFRFVGDRRDFAVLGRTLPLP
ncbi:GNAT family N-acetyltransferase [Tomitella cavernea]|uniref:N-acetyltransferase n=1 Tax=Tomitella cavernea TaxID=1387982 RepID=A0ABP9CUU9_9ACTN|nr:GNAT family N-acetyltransferase [Tomitella cavernea]